MTGVVEIQIPSRGSGIDLKWSAHVSKEIVTLILPSTGELGMV